MNAILGMDFLIAYGAVINLIADQVSLRSGLQINTLEEECLDDMKVSLRSRCAIKPSHLNRCKAGVEDVVG